MDFYEIFVRSPINGSARNMITYKQSVERDIQKDELVYLIARLERKRRLLNKALGITSKAQRKNLMYRIGKKRPTMRTVHNPRGVDEWYRNGIAIRRLCDELAARKI